MCITQLFLNNKYRKKHYSVIYKHTFLYQYHLATIHQEEFANNERGRGRFNPIPFDK